MRSIFLVLFISVFVASVAQAQLTPDHALGAGEMLQGNFIQERHLTGMSKPIHSQGRFLLAPSKGLIWRAEKPFAVIAVITPAGLMQKVGNGAPMRLPAAKVPFLGRFYDMLSRALGGDWSALDHDFAIEKSGTPDKWTIVLKPHKPDDPVAGQLASITVHGSALVDTVEIHRPNGDWEQIAFVDQVRAPVAISADDTALLASVAP